MKNKYEKYWNDLKDLVSIKASHYELDSNWGSETYDEFERYDYEILFLKDGISFEYEIHIKTKDSGSCIGIKELVNGELDSDWFLERLEDIGIVLLDFKG